MSAETTTSGFEVEALDPEKLAEVPKMAQRMHSLRAEIEEKTAALAKLQETYEALEIIHLPGLMMELGMTYFELVGGTSIEVKKEYHCSITELNAPKAFAWLRANNSESLIKRELGVTFGKGDDAKAIKVLAALKKLVGDEIPVKNKQFVHPQTLKAFVKERIESEQTLPRDIFSVHEIQRARIKEPKT